MKVLVEVCDKNDLRNMLWSGAVDTVNRITSSEAKTILEILEDAYHNDLLTLTQLNDFFWFEGDTIAEWLGYDNFEEL